MIRCKKRETTSRLSRRRESRGWEESLRVRLEEDGSPSAPDCGAGTIGTSVSSTLTGVGGSAVITTVDMGTSCSVGAGAGKVGGSLSVAAWIACTMAFASLTFCFSARLTVFSVYPFGSKTPSRIEF